MMRPETCTVISEHPDDTFTAGEIIGRALKPGDVVALIGELGAGKTCITRGIARGIGISDSYYITSPTFTLINEYPGRIPLYHMDMYRISGPEYMEDIGFDEYLSGGGVVVVEWAERIAGILPSGTLYIHIEYRGEQERNIHLSGRPDLILEIRNDLEKGGCALWL